jgi:pimeloyl-ACP methyl ester carboxylesterase
MMAARGRAFHAQEMGDPQAPPAVLLHGLFVGSLASWYFMSAPALARSHRVLMFDLRGHGRSDRPKDGYDLASQTADLAALADAFDGRPLDVAGHSYGALVALRFALDHPGRVRRLALVEAPLPPSRFRDFDDFLARSPEEMAGLLPSDLRAVVASGGRRAARLVESLGFLAKETTLIADLRAEPDIPDADLARVTCPTLCVYGDRSSCLPVGDRLARAIPGARLRVLPGGHYLHLDATAALTAALLEHFDG